eukprot:2939314-Amphidinium_carterae.1
MLNRSPTTRQNTCMQSTDGIVCLLAAPESQKRMTFVVCSMERERESAAALLWPSQIHKSGHVPSDDNAGTA